MNPRDILLAIAVAAIWGFNFVVIRYGVEEMPPLLLTALRFLFSALPAVFFLPPPRARVGLVVAFGFLLGVVKFGTVFTAIKLGMPAGLASLVMQMQVFFTIALAAALMGERPTRAHVAGAAVALCGVLVIGLSTSGGGPLVPFLLTLFAAFAWGMANIVSKRAAGADMLAFVVWASLVPPLPLLALSLWFDGPAAVWAPMAHPTAMAAACLFFLVVPSTLFCFSVWSRLLNRYPAAVVAPFALLVPVFGFLSGWLVLGEAMTAPIILGAALVLAGLAINVFGAKLLSAMR